MRNFLLVCDNGSGEKITIGYRWPLWLDAVDGLTSSDFDVDTEKATIRTANTTSPAQP